MELSSVFVSRLPPFIQLPLHPIGPGKFVFAVRKANDKIASICLLSKGTKASQFSYGSGNPSFVMYTACRSLLREGNIGGLNSCY